MKNLIVLALCFLVLCCSTKKSKNRIYEIEQLTVGLNHLEAFKVEKGDSFRFYPPQPPPFPGDHSNINLFEGKNGEVYFYIFKDKEPLCGFMEEGSKYEFDVYWPEFSRLSRNDITKLSIDNVDSFINATLSRKTKEQRPIYTIGIQADTSINQTLLLVTNRLYQNSQDNIWKIRAVLPKENLLTE